MSLASGQKITNKFGRKLPGRILQGSLLTLAWNTSLMAGAPAAILDHKMLCNKGHVLRQCSKKIQKVYDLETL